MKKQNVLFVGDIRTTCNFGAIATTETLMKMIVDKVNSSEHFKSIDARAHTMEGMDNIHRGVSVEEYCTTRINSTLLKNKSKKQKLIEFLNKIGALSMVLKLYHIFKKPTVITDRVPARLCEYDSYCNLAQNGQLEWNYENDKIEWADIIIINSEGAIVKGTEVTGKYKVDARYNLFLAYYSKKIYNKKVYIINHTVDPHNRDAIEIINYIYPMLDGVYLRETMSYNNINAETMAVKFVPDALFAYISNYKTDYSKYGIDISKPYICIGDSSGFSALGVGVSYDYEVFFDRFITELKKNICEQIIFIDGFRGENNKINKVITNNNMPFVGLQNATYHDLANILRLSMIFISGRWHASILALLGGTPILCWGADSHKTEALYKIIDYPYYFFDINSLPINVDRLIEEINKVLKSENEITIHKRIETLIEGSHFNADMI